MKLFKFIKPYIINPGAFKSAYVSHHWCNSNSSAAERIVNSRCRRKIPSTSWLFPQLLLSVFYTSYFRYFLLFYSSRQLLLPHDFFLNSRIVFFFFFFYRLLPSHWFSLHLQLWSDVLKFFFLTFLTFTFSLNLNV